MNIFYHGTSTLFYRFDLSHILEGDGKIKFGYGIYVTSKYETAAHYSGARKEATQHYVYTVEVPDRKDDNFIEFHKPMNIEGIYSLYQFVEILNKLCKREEEHFVLDVYNQDRKYDNTHANHSVTGINFELKLKDCDFQAWGWIGIYFSDEIPTICIGFNDTENWGKCVCDLIKNAKSEIADGQLCTAPYPEDGAYWFNFIDGKDTYEECFNKLSLNEQIEQIKAFMDEVFNLIYGLFEESRTK